MKKQKQNTRKNIPSEVKTIANFGKRLRALRKKAGYSSQLTFAYEKELNPRRYGEWEKGAEIKLSSIVKLCRALNITLSEFFNEGFEE